MGWVRPDAYRESAPASMPRTQKLQVLKWLDRVDGDDTCKSYFVQHRVGMSPLRSMHKIMQALLFVSCSIFERTQNSGDRFGSDDDQHIRLLGTARANPLECSLRGQSNLVSWLLSPLTLFVGLRPR